MGGRMFRTAAKFRSTQYVRCWLNADEHGDRNPCFKGWPTLAMFNYFQNQIWLSAEDSPEKGDRNQRGEDTEIIRAQLQELLWNAHAEAEKAKQLSRRDAYQ